jgi:hypothetical protein
MTDKTAPNANAPGPGSDAGVWQILEPRFYDEPGSRARVGPLVLATDMAVEQALLKYMRREGVNCFTSLYADGVESRQGIASGA